MPISFPKQLYSIQVQLHCSEDPCSSFLSFFGVSVCIRVGSPLSAFFWICNYVKNALWVMIYRCFQLQSKCWIETRRGLVTTRITLREALVHAYLICFCNSNARAAFLATSEENVLACDFVYLFSKYEMTIAKKPRVFRKRFHNSVISEKTKLLFKIHSYYVY